MNKSCNMYTSQPGGPTLRVGDDGRFSYLDAAGTSGWVNLGFQATIQGTVCAATPRKVERVKEDGFDLLLDYGPFPVEEQVRIRRLRVEPEESLALHGGRACGEPGYGQAGSAQPRPPEEPSDPLGGRACGEPMRPAAGQLAVTLPRRASRVFQVRRTGADRA
ncbi:MAG: hypothetical protein WCI17_11345 [bacterium]